jgi:hypothetical protein
LLGFSLNIRPESPKFKLISDFLSQNCGPLAAKLSLATRWTQLGIYISLGGAALHNADAACLSEMMQLSSYMAHVEKCDWVVWLAVSECLAAVHCLAQGFVYWRMSAAIP